MIYRRIHRWICRWIYLSIRLKPPQCRSIKTNIERFLQRRVVSSQPHRDIFSENLIVQTYCQRAHAINSFRNIFRKKKHNYSLTQVFAYPTPTPTENVVFQSHINKLLKLKFNSAINSIVRWLHRKYCNQIALCAANT